MKKRNPRRASYSKAAKRRIKVPNFLSRLKNDPKVGERILAKYGDSLS
jgi:hypothetical protein